MQKFAYPASDLDRSRAILRVLGSFWAITYAAKDQLRAFSQAIAAGVNQNTQNLTETVDALSRHDIQIFHTENWTPIKLKKSELNKTSANYYLFDDDDKISFDGQPAVFFDQFKPTDFYAFSIPDKLAGVGHIYDKIIFPTIGLMRGVDYVLDDKNGTIIFANNPFNIPELTPTKEYKNGQIVDETITLWGFKAKFDYARLFNQFAYALNMRLRSSENAKKLLNAIFDGLIAAGASAAVLEAALAAICDIPLVETDNETVEVIALDNRGLIIATDRNAYRFAATAAPIVQVGDKLNAGDRLTNAFEVVRFNRGEVPASVTALALDNGFTAACLYSDLIFENVNVPVEVNNAHPSGFTYVKFRVGGFPPDVQKFFDEMHARGIEAINNNAAAECAPPGILRGTLAHYLDLRKTPVGEPAAEDLPATINPLKFIVENVLKNNVTVIIVRISELGKNHLGLYNIRHIRQLLPPHAALIFNYLIAGRSDQVDSQTMADTINKFKAAEPFAETVAENMVNDRGITVRVVSGSCQ